MAYRNNKREFQRQEYGTDPRYRSDDPINLEVTLKDGESTERLIRRFLKKFKKLKLMEEFKSHEFYEKPSLKRRLAKKKSDAKIRKLQREREENE